MKQLKAKHYLKGLAAVEMTLILPVLLLILMAIWEFTQILQAHIVLLNLSREGANLISRSSSYGEQDVMDILSHSSNPLDLTQSGTMYINVISKDGDTTYISSQTKWLNATTQLSSEVWDGCTQWDDDNQCTYPSSIADLKLNSTDFPLQLEDGESVYVVEVLYEYTAPSSFVFDSDLLITERTYL
ncbi:hypothetical protein A9264_01635 [Vibrio sp. UCD-FRSSP16_10]|uniref:TadE/TadG family type IV pilus assembly protein n=1 Tax=unclassified Vibrio TaxID=2614977 RepID=UPI0008014EB3|nr:MULTISPECIES: TadE/TadG family type IV pilus assembly protein [unclassified Vibrio]OBT13868.1 hypothetical protein A9260_03085 [Vibrio sp. UCD-FRSSP16_30]OBT22749.1 hypothetical protein A9264_01635 [Vibrio sp. UCD-FRSSP16_10]